MAEINIEKKSGPPAWLWIVGLVVLALIAWAVISMMTGDDRDDWTTAQDTAVTTTQPAQTPATTPGGPMAVQTFSRECAVDEGQRTDDMGLDHEFTVNCLEQLAASIESVAQQTAGQPNVNPQVQTIRQNAQQIRDSDPMSTQHANWTREALNAGVTAMESLQQAGTAADQQAQNSIAQARQAAQQMQTSEVQLEQLTHIRSYMRNAAQALDSLSRQRA
jgi:hypothetical protein